MGKLITFLALILTLLININTSFTCAEAKTMNGYEIYYDAEIFEPFSQKFSKNISGVVSIRSGASNNNLRLRYELFSHLKYGLNRSYANGYACAKFSYPQTSVISYSFTINDYYNIAREPVLIKFGLYDLTKKTYLNYLESHINTIKENYIDLDEVVGDLVYDTCLCLAEKDTTETFNFSNFSSVLELDKYYRLDLSSLSLYYKCFKTFECDNAEISFIDTNNNFPYIEADESGIKHVPVYPSVKDNNVTFIYKGLYVKESTLEMSLVNREGFTYTNYFYLPKNKLKSLQGQKLVFSGTRFGVNNITFQCQMSLSVDSLLIGPCNQSNFCIVGGVKA